MRSKVRARSILDRGVYPVKVIWRTFSPQTLSKKQINRTIGNLRKMPNLENCG